MRGLVVLQRVIGEVLPALGEHHAVDLHVGAGADQGHVLVHLGQPAAQGADGPLQRGVVVDQRPLMGEVPDAGAPVLQVDVSQLRPRADVDFDGPAVQARRPSASRLAGFGQHGRLGALVRARSASGRNRRRRAKGPKACAAAVRSPRPWARRAAFRPTSRRHAARRTCRPDNRPPRTRYGRSRSPCSTTSRSRLPKSTPCSANAGSRCSRPSRPSSSGHARPARSTSSVEKLARPGDVDGMAPDGVAIAAGTSEPLSGAEWLEAEAADVGPHPLFLLPVGQRQFLETSPRPRAAAQRSHAGSRRSARNASNDSGVKPVGELRRCHDCDRCDFVSCRATTAKRLRPAFATCSQQFAICNRPYPTVPSICNSISRFISTAYSIGSS